MVALISVTLLGIEHCFGVPLFPGWGSSSGFPLGLSHHYKHHSIVRKPVWKFCHLVCISILIMHSGTGKDGFRDLLEPYVKTLLIIWPPQVLPLTGRSQGYFRSPRINTTSDPVSNSLWKVWLFPFLQWITLVRVYRCLWGRLGERLTVYIFSSVAEFFLKGRWPSLHSRDSSFKNWLKSGN